MCGSSFFLLCFLLSLIVVHYACDCSCTYEGQHFTGSVDDEPQWEESQTGEPLPPRATMYLDWTGIRREEEEEDEEDEEEEEEEEVEERRRRGGDRERG